MFEILLLWLLASNQQRTPDIQKVAVDWAQVVELVPKIQEKVSTPKIIPKKAQKKASKGRFIEKPLVLEDWKEEIARYICTKDWDCKTAVAICYAGSGLNPNMKSKTNDHGVCDINAYWQRNRIKGRDLYDWKQNVDIMHEIYQEQGFEPYYQFKNETYKKYLNIQTASGSIIGNTNQ